MLSANHNLVLTIQKINEQDILSDLFDSLGRKSHMRHERKCFGQVPLVNSNNAKESKFSKKVKTF